MRAPVLTVLTASLAVVLAAAVVAACGSGPGTNPNGCDDSRSECDGVCVDRDSDPLHCGACGNACAIGDVCVDGDCTAWDCREAPCPGLAYCDLSTGTCLAGCAFDDQCGPNEACELASHDCDCVDGAHRCSGACSPDTAVETCGDRCDPCPDDPNGDAICQAGSCSFACDAGTRLCGGRCAECPAGNSFGCDGDQCVPNTCAAGSLLCDGACADCPVGSDFGCDGGECIATSCPGGYELCGGACAACPDALETACSGATCVAVACPTGEVLCATGCCPWQIETATPDRGEGLDLALGAGGARWISFRKVGGSSVLKVARKSGTTWTTESVIDQDTYDFTGIDLDSAGAPHVASVYPNVNTWVLRHSARSAAGVWSTQQLAIDLQAGEVGLAVDPSDGIHIVYDGSDGPRHAWGPSWNSEYVPTPFLESEDGLAMALDATGGLHVSYLVQIPNDPGYSRRTPSGTWDFQSTYALTPPVGTPAIAATTASNARLAFFSQGTLWLARWNGAAWEKEAVSTTAAAGGRVALALHPTTGAAHMVFLNSAQQVVYTHWTGTQWAEQVVAASTTGSGPTLALELDAMGHPFIAFATGTGGIKLAH